MSSQSSGKTTCKHCDRPLPADNLGRICHACLLSEGLHSATDNDGPETALPTAPDDAFSRHFGPDPLEGATLGPGGRYKILQMLGEGGFGVVYMAEQTAPVRRRVAIKVIKAGMDTRQVVARFEAERQALAMMEHPGIAKVLDGGETDEGRPFFVMELVRGTPITHYCDREQLDTPTRLALFLQVCQAVQHAHQKGIIHRDLKPSNILITAPDGAEPVPKVIDFGVAKAMESSLTDKTLFTRFEQMIGTPAYMSPEQAGSEGGIDVDTRADIYALGVLLYELLTGTTPFEAKTLQKAAFEEVRRILREEEVPRPSARLGSLEAERRTTIAKERGTEVGGLGKQLRGDLDWIVMKAIEKDRRRRYETANALALDVERHLGDEPVSAGPPTAAYRTSKFLRRHKAPLAVAATVLLLLVAGIAATTWQAMRATKEKNRAVEAETQAEERQREAEAISEFITGIFEAAKPGAEEGGRSITVEESLKIAERKLEENQEMPAARRAVLQESIAGVYWSLGHYENAITLQEQVLKYYRVNLGEEHTQTLEAMRKLAGSYRLTGRGKEALTMLQDVIAQHRKVSGPEEPDTLRAMSSLATSYSDSGRRTEALEMREEVLALCRKVFGDEHPSTIDAMYELAISYSESSRLAEAVKIGQQVLALERKAFRDEHPKTISTMNLLANFYDREGRLAEALEIREKALDLSKEVLGDAHPSTRILMDNLGKTYLKSGRVDEGLELIRHLPVKSDSPPVVHVLVPSGSEWRWLHPVDGIDPAESDPDFHQTFFRADYDDSSWQVGTDGDGTRGGFGYGDDDWFEGVDIGLPGVADESGKRNGKSAYFRHRFTTTKTHGQLELRCQRDDGLIVYLDGKEVGRDNMVEGEESYDLPAKWKVGSCTEPIVFRIPLEGVVVPPGDHVLAISLHNPRQPSSDLRIGGITLVELEEDLSNR